MAPLTLHPQNADSVVARQRIFLLVLCKNRNFWYSLKHNLWRIPFDWAPKTPVDDMRIVVRSVVEVLYVRLRNDLLRTINFVLSFHVPHCGHFQSSRHNSLVAINTQQFGFTGFAGFALATATEQNTKMASVREDKKEIHNRDTNIITKCTSTLKRLMGLRSLNNVNFSCRKCFIK